MRFGKKAEGGFASATMAFMAVTICLMAFIAIAVGTTFIEKETPSDFNDIVQGNFVVSLGEIVGNADGAMASHMEFHGYGAMSLELEVLGKVSPCEYRATCGSLDGVEGVCRSEWGTLTLEDEHGRKLPARYVVVAWR
ncbi:MAG: hypothetical protein GX224_04280 [Thermoplasmatales archaeon]|nr:hypothetical protein [Thermoplasmatales archaeon]